MAKVSEVLSVNLLKEAVVKQSQDLNYLLTFEKNYRMLEQEESYI